MHRSAEEALKVYFLREEFYRIERAIRSRMALIKEMKANPDPMYAGWEIWGIAFDRVKRIIQ